MNSMIYVILFMWTCLFIILELYHDIKIYRIKKKLSRLESEMDNRKWNEYMNKLWKVRNK